MTDTLKQYYLMNPHLWWPRLYFMYYHYNF